MQRKLRGAFRWALGGAAGIGFFWLVYVGLTWDMRQDESAAASTYQAVAVERGERLIERRETHLDKLADKLTEERVRRVIEPILAGTDSALVFENYSPKPS